MHKLKVAIIGGGAAGFFAAISAKEECPEAEVTIYERGPKVLAKVAITGGGRCNVTNSFEEISDLKQAYPRGHRLMTRLFKQFDHRNLFEWFENRGVALVTQDDQCVFPRSQDSATIIHCLTTEARRLGVIVLTNSHLQEIKPTEDGRFELVFKQGNRELADRVGVTTGGMPHTSDALSLRQLGHTVEPPIPSLFTFNIKDRQFLDLMGTVVNPVSVSIPSTKLRAEGPLLVTHWGMSGPAILKLSSHAARHLQERQYNVPLAVNWVNETNREHVAQALSEIAIINPQKQLGSVRPYNLPARLWQYILAKIDLAEDRRWAELGQKGQNRLVETLTNDIYQVNGKGAFREEFVTCGGVSLADVDSHTLESKRCPHLFFAGEVLDIDAITGGFNLQAAWTTGFVMGKNIVK
ncbi:MAG: NAD(P)/FAD-dependent oxidoreductase [Prevotella sp.]|nr:NAD(P)/FAD-dependent oxidoreductase [Prevotella sp.]